MASTKANPTTVLDGDKIKGADANLVSDRFNTAQGYWKTDFANKRKLLKDYRCEFNFEKDEQGKLKWRWRSKIFLPMVQEKVETIYPQVYKQIFPKPEFFSVQPGRGMRDVQTAKITEKLLFQQLKQTRFQERMQAVILEALLLGCKFIRTEWRVESKWRKDVQDILDPDYGIKVGERVYWVEEELYDGPDFTSIPFYRMYIDPATPPDDLNKAEFIIEDMVVNLDQFMMDAQSYDYTNIDEVIEAVKKAPGTTQASDDERSLPSDTHSKAIRILMYYDHDQILYKAITAGKGPLDGVIVRQQDFWDACPGGEYPYVGYKIKPGIDSGSDISSDQPGSDSEYHPGGFYPQGVLHSLHGLQTGINLRYNQKNDLVNMGLNPPLIVDSSALEDEEALEYGFNPGLILHSTSKRPLSEILFQVPISNYMQGSEMIAHNQDMEMAERVTGANDIISGRQERGNQTATAAMQKSENAVSRFGMSSESLIFTGIKPHLNQYVYLNAEFLKPGTLLEMVGSGPPVVIDKKAVQTNVSFNISPAIYFNPMYISKVLREVLPTVEKYPFVNIKPIIRAILENLKIFDDIDTIIQDDGQPFTSIDFQMLEMGLRNGMLPGNNQARDPRLAAAPRMPQGRFRQPL